MTQEQSHRPLVAATMIVKNEEDFLLPALESTKGWVDEVIVVDTGSTDRTVEIAERFGAQIYHFEWCDDFSKARNYSLRQSNARFNLVLDADERLTGHDPSAFRDALRNTPIGHPFHVFRLEVVNQRQDGSTISSLDSVRIFPNDERLGYTGRVHNMFGSLDPSTKELISAPAPGLKIIHLGYDPDLYDKRQKSARSLPLIELTLEEEPENIVYRFYLGREYRTLGRFEEAEEALRTVVRQYANSPEADLDVWRESWIHLLECMRTNGRAADEIHEEGRLALQYFPQSPDIAFVIANALADSGRNEEAIPFAERALEFLSTSKNETTQFVGQRPWDVHHRLGLCLAETGALDKAYTHFLQAVDQKPEIDPMWPELVSCTLGLALDLKDNARWGPLSDRLLTRSEAPMDMFWLTLDRLEALGEKTEVLRLLDRARSLERGETRERTERLRRLGSM